MNRMEDNYARGMRIGPPVKGYPFRTSESHMGELRCADSTREPVGLSIRHFSSGFLREAISRITCGYSSYEQ